MLFVIVVNILTFRTKQAIVLFLHKEQENVKNSIDILVSFVWLHVIF